jgi:hypothetical protein
MNSGMYNSNNGVIGNIWRQKVSQSDKEGMHSIPKLDEDVYNLFNAWNFQLPDNVDDINNFIVNLKCELGIEKMNDVFDCFYILAAATQSQSLINWAQPGRYNLTYEGGTDLTFTALRGWRASSNVAVAWLNTNFNPYFEVCNFNNNVPVYDSTAETATYSYYNYGGAMGIYINQIPVDAYITPFIYDIGSHRGLNTPGYGNSISVLSNNSVSYQYASYLTRINGQASQNPMYGGSTNASQGVFNFPPFYSIVRTDLYKFQIYCNGQVNMTQLNNIPNTIALGTPASTLFGTASAPGPIIFPSINISTTGTVSKNLVQGQPLRQFAFVFIGSRSIDQSILYNNVNNYLHSIGAAVVNS